MFRFLNFVCWQTKIKIGLDQVLDIAPDGSCQDQRTCKLQKEEFSFYKARLIKNQARPIENRKQQILNQA